MVTEDKNSIILRNMDYSYPKSQTKALDAVDFVLHPGDFVILTGTSGSGKTTLIRALRGEITPTSGDLQILGRNIRKKRNVNSLILRRRIAVVYQDFKLIENKTVFDNIAYPLEVSGYNPMAVKTRAMQSLEMLDLDRHVNKYPRDISGGELQRVAIARAISMKPAVILADEPTGNLDKDSGMNVFTVLKNLSINGTAVLIATHDTTACANIESLRYVMSGGVVKPEEYHLV